MSDGMTLLGMRATCICDKGPDRRGDDDPAGDGSVSFGSVHDASRGDMHPAPDDMPGCKPRFSDVERSRPVIDLGFHPRTHHAASTTLRAT